MGECVIMCHRSTIATAPRRFHGPSYSYTSCDAEKSSNRKTGGLRGSIIEIQRVQTLDNDMEAVHFLVYLL